MTIQLHSIFVKPENAKWNLYTWKMHRDKYDLISQIDTITNIMPKVCNYITCNDTCDALLLLHSNGFDRLFFEDAPG